MKTRPANLSYYRKTTSVHLAFLPPTEGEPFTTNKGEMVTPLEQGCLMLQVIPLENEKLNHKEGLSFKLGIPDISSINDWFTRLEKTPGEKIPEFQPLRLVHDPHAKSDKSGQVNNTLTVSTLLGNNGLGISLSLKTKKEGEDKQSTFVMSLPEARTFYNLMSQSPARVLGW